MNESTEATENVFQYNVNAMCIETAKPEQQPLTRESWIFDTGASFHICNDWQIMEDVVEGENRITTASNGEQQSGNLFGKVNIVVQSGNGKRIIT